MDFITQNAILCEAEKLTNEFIQIVWRKDNAGEYTLCAVAFMDGRGNPVDYLTDFAKPSEVLANLKRTNTEKAMAAQMFAGIPENPGEADLIAANMD